MNSDFWQRGDKQLSFDLFFGPVQFSSSQARTDFSVCHPMENKTKQTKLVVFHLNLGFQDLESRNSAEL